MGKVIRIIIIDDIKIYREGVRHSLSEQKDMEVIGDTDNGEDALVEIREKNPDVVVLDYELLSRGIEGMALIQCIRKTFPHVKIVSDTIKKDPFLLLRLIEEGVHAICPKEDALLLKAIREVMNEGHIFPPKCGYETIQAGIEKSILQVLTDTERHYFTLVGNGLDEDKDALVTKLGIEPGYLKNIQSHMKKKLGVKNTDELKALYKKFNPDKFE